MRIKSLYNHSPAMAGSEPVARGCLVDSTPQSAPPRLGLGCKGPAQKTRESGFPVTLQNG